jgi:outer membrane protein, multidrug efflux system
VAEAARYPSLSLTGNILPSLTSLNGSPLATVLTWAFGPALTLPLADGGRRTANIEAAKVQFTALDSVLRARVRQAVREVEEALVRVDAARLRESESAAAHEALSSALQSTQARVKTGLGSQLELLEAQRNTLAVHAGVIQARQELAGAWVALYRAVGGGWDGELALPINASSGTNIPEQTGTTRNITDAIHATPGKSN